MAQKIIKYNIDECIIALINSYTYWFFFFFYKLLTKIIIVNRLLKFKNLEEFLV